MDLGHVASNQVWHRQSARLTAALLAIALSSVAFAAPSEGEIDVTIFRAQQPLNIPLPINHLFGGLLSQVQQKTMGSLFLGLAAFVLLMLAIRSLKQPVNHRLWLGISLTGVFMFSAIVSFKVCNGWDELFIGAKHAHSMLVANKFSYNVSNMQEGNTEFLPLFATGLLAKLGFPIVETLLTLGLLGNLWLILIAYKFFSRLTRSVAAGFVYATGVGLFPCVVITAMSGFFCCLFSAAALSAIYSLFFSDRPNARTWGLALLAFLTLFRMEGVLICFLVWLYLFVVSRYKSFVRSNERGEAIKSAFLYGVMLATPFAVACGVRYLAFGHAIPAPAALKNAGGDPVFIRSGLGYLKGVLDSFELRELLILTVPAAIVAIFAERWIRKLVVAWLILIAFSAPYLVGGGDWFPAHWARYFMPAILASYFVFWGSWATLARHYAAHVRYFQPALAIALVCAPYIAEKPFFEASDGLNAFGLSRRFVNDNGYYWQWGRVNALGAYGLFLKETTSPNELIGSPEEATMMYFADRDVVDLMGFATPEIAYSRVDPLRPGNILHRKRNPATLLNYKPGIVALWELAYKEANPEAWPTDAQYMDHVVTMYHQFGFGQDQIDIAYFRVGSFEYLRKLGYRLIFVGTGRFLFFYWVNDRIYKDHIAALDRLGCKQVGTRSLHYRVTPTVSNHFSSGEELLNRP